MKLPLWMLIYSQENCEHINLQLKKFIELNPIPHVLRNIY